MTLPGLARDAVIIDRPGGGGTPDRYGRGGATLSRVFDGRATWGSPSARDREFAAKMGQVIDGVVAGAVGVARKGDVVTTRATTWRVEAVMDVRTHWRLLLSSLAVNAAPGFGSFARGFAA